MLVLSDANLFDVIQREAIAWQTRNFPDNRADHSLRGMIEELGELAEAITRAPGMVLAMEGVLAKTAEVADAIGDWGVFCLNYCSARGWVFSEIVDHLDAPETPITETFAMLPSGVQLLILAGRLAHHDLKLDQRIRKNEDHTEALQRVIREIVRVLIPIAKEHRLKFTEILATTWAQVKQRDWTKERATSADTLPDGAGLYLQRIHDEKLGQALDALIADTPGVGPPVFLKADERGVGATVTPQPQPPPDDKPVGTIQPVKGFPGAWAGGPVKRGPEGQDSYKTPDPVTTCGVCAARQDPPGNGKRKHYPGCSLAQEGDEILPFGISPPESRGGIGGPQGSGPFDGGKPGE